MALPVSETQPICLLQLKSLITMFAVLNYQNISIQIFFLTNVYAFLFFVCCKLLSIISMFQYNCMNAVEMYRTIRIS